jgi:hypothetical protein
MQFTSGVHSTGSYVTILVLALQGNNAWTSLPGVMQSEERR